MHDKQRWHDRGWDEKRRSERPGVNLDSELALVERIQEIGAAPHIE